MRFSAAGERAGLQASVPGLDEKGFSLGDSTQSISEMGSSVYFARFAVARIFRKLMEKLRGHIC